MILSKIPSALLARVTLFVVVILLLLTALVANGVTVAVSSSTVALFVVVLIVITVTIAPVTLLHKQRSNTGLKYSSEGESLQSVYSFNTDH